MKEKLYKKPDGDLVLHATDALKPGSKVKKQASTSWPASEDEVKKKKSTTIKMNRDYVLLKPMAPVTTTESGIAVIAISKIAPKACIVIKVGPGFYDKFGNFLEVPCQPGDLVMVAQGNLNEVEITGEKFIVVPSSEILVIIR